MITNGQYLTLFSLTFILVGALTPIMREIALKYNFVDKPNATHKSHEQAIAYLGGVAISLGISLVIFGAVITQANLSGEITLASSLLGPALALGIVGLIDDRRALPPLPRFLVQSAAGTFTAFLVISTNTVGNPSGSSLLDAAITVLWIVGITNAINFFDNLDGGAAGAVAISSVGIFLIAYSNGQFLISATAIIISAATLGFLIWNKSPAKIYMGDAGSLFLGTLLAVLTIRLNPDVGSKSISFSIPLLLLALPILDTSVAVISRIRRRKSIFQGGKDHLSHRLIRKGFTKRQAAYALWSLAGIFVAPAVTIATSNYPSTFLTFIAGTFWLGLLAVFLASADE